MAQTPHPRVFISYTHDSKEHKNNVFNLSQRLIDWGIDCYIDQYEMDPPEGWPKWMSSQLKAADFVLVAATPTYLKRFEGEEELGKGKGAKWEGGIVIRKLYESEGVNTKFIPIVFRIEDVSSIPEPLTEKTYYDVSTKEGFELMYRRLTNQPPVIRGKPKELRILPPSNVPEDTVIDSKLATSLKLGNENNNPPSASYLHGESTEMESKEKALDKVPLQELTTKEQDYKTPNTEVEPSLPDPLYFDPMSLLEHSVLTFPLSKFFEENRRYEAKHSTTLTYPVIIELNRQYAGSSTDARNRVLSILSGILKEIQETGLINNEPTKSGTNGIKSAISGQYIFATLQESVIRELARRDRLLSDSDSHGRAKQAIYRIWPDFEVKAFSGATLGTIKANVAHQSFGAVGEGIVWAVIDSGIDQEHPHFKLHANLLLNPPLSHRDFTIQNETFSINSSIPQNNETLSGSIGHPLEDTYGHGTHIAGVIAGEIKASSQEGQQKNIAAAHFFRDEYNRLIKSYETVNYISGVAPRCKLLSLKVLNENGGGSCSSIISALEYINQINEYGRRIIVHGVNISVGYTFNPTWFASGLTPLCNEINRLVESGVVVVVPAGNTDYGFVKNEYSSVLPNMFESTIGDPGNAELAITVGATHGFLPHVYGVSFFSSKGPTADGRLKPDIVAPGEKILSCDSGQRRKRMGYEELVAEYKEESGTSQAAAHVSGAVAAFLSVHKDYIGRPKETKKVFLESSKDLGRMAAYQGYGLLDLKNAIEQAK